MKKIYTYESLTFGYSLYYKKWLFKWGETSNYLAACHGPEQAMKVARIIYGGIKRCGNIDGLSRANVASVLR